MTMWNVDENAVDADFQVGTHSFSHSVSVLSFDLCIREALKNFFLGIIPKPLDPQAL